MKCQKNLFIFILIYSLFEISFEQTDPEFSGNTNIKLDNFGNNIIYIVNQANNQEIKIYNRETTSISHGSSIINNKDILKINDSNFIIIGSNLNNINPCFEIYKIENDGRISLIKSICIINIAFNDLIRMEARYIGDEKLIIYTVESSVSKIFRCYLIDFN